MLHWRTERLAEESWEGGGGAALKSALPHLSKENMIGHGSAFFILARSFLDLAFLKSHIDLENHTRFWHRFGHRSIIPSSSSSLMMMMVYMLHATYMLFIVEELNGLLSDGSLAH